MAAKHSIPWVFGGCLGADGQTMTIIPGDTPCLNCLMLEGPPTPGASPTCDSFGILSPIINTVASLECIEAIKILSGHREKINRKMTVIGLWDNQLRQFDVSNLRETVDCPTCKNGQYRWLTGERGSRTAVLCGRNAVQLSFPGRQIVDLVDLESRLGELGEVSRNAFMLRFRTAEYQLTIFTDGRTIVNGTEDIAVAKKVHAQFVGA